MCVTPDTVVEAQPGGARLTPLANYLGPNTLWSNGYGLAGNDREHIAVTAGALVGVPYGWPDIAAITLAQKRLGKWQRINAETPDAKQPWWVRRLARTDRLICSQLVDYAYYLAGVHLYDDGRCFGLVSPGDLGGLITKEKR